MLLEAPWPQTVVAYAICVCLYSVVWTYDFKSYHRCVLELNTGFFLIIAAYSNWLYLVVFILYSIGDIFSPNQTIHRFAASGLIYFYAHTIVVLAASQPLLTIVPAILIAGRLYRAKPAKKAGYSLYDIRVPHDYLAYMV